MGWDDFCCMFSGRGLQVTGEQGAETQVLSCCCSAATGILPSPSSDGHLCFSLVLDTQMRGEFFMDLANSLSRPVLFLDGRPQAQKDLRALPAHWPWVCSRTAGHSSTALPHNPSCTPPAGTT